MQANAANVLRKRQNGISALGATVLGRERMTAPESIISRAHLPALGSDVTAIIRENIGIMMTYAFSRKALEEYRSLHIGDWKRLEYAIFVLPEKRATRACIELAVMLRALDEVATLASLRGKLFEALWGKFYDNAGEPQPLQFREALNKIIHAKSIKWDFTRPDIPVVVCEASQEQADRYGWTKAEIQIDTLGTACGMLAG
jgi:hypothetical protein